MKLSKYLPSVQACLAESRRAFFLRAGVKKTLLNILSIATPKNLGFVFILSALIFPLTLSNLLYSKEAWGTEDSFKLTSPQTNETKSVFEEKYLSHEEPIQFETQKINDPEIELGETVLVQAGKNGARIRKIKVTYHNGEEFSREVVSTEISDPQPQIVKIGTKKIIRELPSDYGVLHYFKKLTVFATSYDSSCHGCNETTALGLKTGYGVIAVDPNVITLRTRVYIPGYGLAIAGDVGGAIKGNKIDLGFDDIKSGWWSSRYVDIYL